MKLQDKLILKKYVNGVSDESNIFTAALAYRFIEVNTYAISKYLNRLNKIVKANPGAYLNRWGIDKKWIDMFWDKRKRKYIVGNKLCSITYDFLYVYMLIKTNIFPKPENDLRIVNSNNDIPLSLLEKLNEENCKFKDYTIAHNKYSLKVCEVYYKNSSSNQLSNKLLDYEKGILYLSNVILTKKDGELYMMKGI